MEARKRERVTVDNLPVLSPADFVALLNQTFEYAFPQVVIEGELSNVRISKNRWVYFDIKDEEASVRCFGTVYSLPGPIEDGMKVRLYGSPRMHQQYSFSFSFNAMSLSGEGTIKKAYELLKEKLSKEGLFDPARKRELVYPPTKVGLITSYESAAYGDFMKILNARWQGVEVELADVQVQGEMAAGQIAGAIEYFNKSGSPVDVLVIIRGGGSADDLQAYDSENVVRAIASSRIPTLVAIGHERDVSLSELASDVRASTPSNSAELLVPNKVDVKRYLLDCKKQANNALDAFVTNKLLGLRNQKNIFDSHIDGLIKGELAKLSQLKKILGMLDPHSLLGKGYSIARKGGLTINSVKNIKAGDTLEIQLSDGSLNTKVQ